MSATPRTDAEVAKREAYNKQFVMETPTLLSPDFARTLELELTKAKSDEQQWRRIAHAMVKSFRQIVDAPGCGEATRAVELMQLKERVWELEERRVRELESVLNP